MGGSNSTCLVRNQSGRPIRIVCSAASGVRPADPAHENAEKPWTHGAVVAAGSEHAVEAPFCDGKGLRLELHFSDADIRVLVLPNDGTLVIRRHSGEVVFRVWDKSKESWATPSVIVECSVPPPRPGPAKATNTIAADPSPLVHSNDSLVADVSDAGAVDDASERLPFASDLPIGAASAADDVAAEARPPKIQKNCASSPSSANSRAPSLECSCPISHDFFVDPVLASDGFTYERSCIQDWWSRKGLRSPLTGQPLDSEALIPNIAMRALTKEQTQRGAPAGDAQPRGSFYEQHMASLVGMFGHLAEQDIRGVCGGLVEKGIEDIDLCVRKLLEMTAGGGRAAAVSLAPMCCADEGACDVEAAEALIDPSRWVPSGWTAGQEQLFAELLELHIQPVRAQKAIEVGAADTLPEALEWLEKHQSDKDIDTPTEVLKGREALLVVTRVLRVGTVAPAHRLECFKSLHQVMGRILADPSNEKVRKLRVRNPKFHKLLGRFPQAVALLRSIGFVDGEYWVAAFEKEACLEFRLPVDSDNLMSQRFVRAFSLIEEIMRAPEEWLPGLPAEPPPEAAGSVPSTQPDACQAGAALRDFMAEVHERRARNPRAFQEAMRAAGKVGNRLVLDVRAPASSTNQTSFPSGAAERGPGGYRPLSERFGGRREFDLRDLEAMRYQDAIASCPQYAEEYDREKGSAASYAELLTRSYDPQYLGRKALDCTNAFRADQQMPPLRWSQAISDIAAEHARQMACGEMPFSHKGFEERVRQYPVPYMTAAENLAYNAGVANTSETAVNGWINSPGHRKNLLGSFDLCGIGVARSASGATFFTQLFARTVGGPLA